MKLKLLLTIITLVLLIFFYQPKNNWQFYTEHKIGPNNNLSFYQNLTTDGQNLYLNAQSGDTLAINKKSGNIKWIFRADNYAPFLPLVDGENIFLTRFDKAIYALDKKSGYQKWKFGLTALPDTRSVTGESAEAIFVGTRDGKLHAIDKKSGQEIWVREFANIDVGKHFINNSIHFGNIYYSHDTLYVWHALENKFMAINADDGTSRWEVKGVDFSFSHPIFYQNRIILQTHKQIVNIDQKSGNSITTVKEDPESILVQKVLEDEENLIIIKNQQLSKTNLSLEKPHWQIAGIDGVLTEETRSGEYPIKAINQKIFAQKYILLENKTILMSIDYNTGSTNWTQKVSGSINTQTYLNNEELVTGGSDGQINRININDGKIHWQDHIDGKIIKIIKKNEDLLVISEKNGQKIGIYYYQKAEKLLWQYTPEFNIGPKEVYHENERIFLVNNHKNLIESILISRKKPNPKQFELKNFKINSVKETKDQSSVEEKQTEPSFEIFKENNLTSKINLYFNSKVYLIKNLSKLFSFNQSINKSDNFFEITVNHDEQLYNNKFLDVHLEATFINQNNQQQTTARGFYYDFNTWKVRFLPNEPGDYRYQIKIETPYWRKTFSGEVEITVSRQEKIAVVDQHFAINNHAFWPIGIQDAFFDRNYNGQYFEEMQASNLANPTLDREQYAYLPLAKYLDIYSQEAGINLFRYGVENWTPPLWNSLELERYALSVNGGKFGDELLSELKRRNIKVIMTIFGFYPPYRSSAEISDKKHQQALATYLDYVIARFGPYVDLWELANEAEPSEAWYDFVIQHLKKNDPYQLPISTNWESSHAKNLDFMSVHWYNPIRSDLGWLAGDIGYVADKYLPSQQPVLISEFGFKDKSWFVGASEQMRIMSWLAIMQNMGLVFWTNSQNGVYENPHNANIYLGPKERAYLKALREFLPPNMSLPISHQFVTYHEQHLQIYNMSNQDWHLAYLLKIEQRSNNPTSIEINLARTGQLQWYEPSTGRIIAEEKVRAGQQQLFTPHFTRDLALRIEYGP